MSDILLEYKTKLESDFKFVNDFALILCLFILMYSNMIGHLFMLFIVCVAVTKRKLLIYTELHKLLFLQLIVTTCVIGLWFSDLLLMAEEIIKSLIIISLLSVFYRSDIAIDRVVNFLFYALLISVAGISYMEHEGRFSSYFSHPNHLAYFCSLVSYALYTMKIKQYHLKIALMFAIVIASKSSGGLIVFLALLSSFLYQQNKRYFLLTVLVLSLLYPIYSFLLYFDIFQILVEKVSGFEVLRVLEKADRLGFGNEGSLIWRIAYWIALLNEFQLSSYLQKLVGMGVGGMSSGNYIFAWMTTDPHNDYIRVLLERGLLGFIAYYVLFIKAINYVDKPARLSLYVITLLPMAVGNILTNAPFIVLLYFLIYCRLREKKEYA